MIHIQFTEEASQAIRQKLRHENIKLKLVYDTEGCGCAVSGIPTLITINEIKEEVKADCDAFPVYYDEQQAVFFEDQLIIDINSNAYGVYVLKSKGQIYSNHMLLKDRVTSS